MSKVIFDPKVMGMKLKKLMKDNELKRVDLADKLGISEDMVYRYEIGSYPLKHDYIVELCNMYDVSLDYFYYKEETVKQEDIKKEFGILLNGKSAEEIKWIYDMVKMAIERPLK